MTLLLLSIGCIGEDTDSTPTDTDTGTTTPVSLDGLLDAGNAWGCQWSYTAIDAGDAWLSMQLALPAEDRYANLDVSYEHVLGAEDSLEIASGPGTGEISLFDCSDLVEGYEDVELWTATAATIDIDAVFVEERPDWTCTGTDPNPVYDATITIRDASFTGSEGGVAELSTLGPFEQRIGHVFCGG